MPNLTRQQIDNITLHGGTSPQLGALIREMLLMQYVETVADRDDISADLRKPGMVVYCRELDKVFRLNVDLATWDTLFYGPMFATPTGGASPILYVDNVNGDDDNVGDVMHKLRTIQEAVNRFCPPGGPPPCWPLGFEPVVFVENTGTTYEEFVIKAPHMGDGILRIVGEETVVYSGLVESGAVATIAGFYAKVRLTTTTSVMTPSALANVAFVRPRVKINDNIIDEYYEYAPVVDNGNNTLDIALYGVGVVSGFGYANGMVFDVVEPGPSWSPEGAAAAFYGSPMFTNLGGGVSIEGFNFPSTASFGRALFCGQAASSVTFGISNTTTVTRSICAVAQNDAPMCQGNGIALAGCIFSAGGSSPYSRVVSQGEDALVLNCIGSCRAEGIKNLSVVGLVGGLDCYAVGPCGLGAQITGVDMRSNQGMVFVSSVLSRVAGISCQGRTGVCIDMTQSHIETLGTNQGTTSNTDVGLRLQEMSSIANGTSGGKTMAGTNGQVRTGSAAVNLWTAATTDTTQLCRFG